MNDFHIYEVIGRSKHSVVYKGRKKKTVDYYGVKSVDKNQRERVLQEIRVLHTVDHPNVMKFYKWYETTNHLWLILEYCVGGNLMSLLRQDLKIPESSIHDFGRDILAALHELHSQGIVHCDLKPSNILLDENGRVKLGGFSLANRACDITLNPRAEGCEAGPVQKKGTPCYMAPELFQVGGCPSFASDLWALGCILYECAAGRPPFVSNSFQELANMVLTEPAPPLKGASVPFRNLVDNLLHKDPGERLSWAEVADHSFWKSKCVNDKPLPRQPAFEQFLLHRGREGFAGEDSPGITCEGSGGELGGDIDEHDENAVPALPVRVNGGDREEPTKKGGSRPQRVGAASLDLTRLSQIASKNLQRDAADYGAEQEAPVGDLRIEDTDTELDFSEDAHRASGEEKAEAGAIDQEEDFSDNAIEREGMAMHVEASKTGQGIDRRLIVIEREAAPDPLATGLAEEVSTSGAAPGEPRSILDLAFHASDLHVKPIVGNRRIEKQRELIWDENLLPFEAIPLKEMLDMDQDNLEAFLSLIYRSVASSTSISERLNVLMYFDGLCRDSTAANVLINSSLMHMFVVKLRTSRVPNIKAHLAGVMGTLVRHATFIAEDVAKTGIVDALTEMLRDKNESVRRRSMAALGELFFYIVTQDQEEQGTVAKGQAAWYVPNGTIVTICRLLRNSDDPVTQHYAVKTLENIFSVGGEWALRLGTHETALSLVQISSSARSEGLKVTASSALARLFRCNSEQSQAMIDKIGVRTLIGFLGDSNLKVQQAFVTIFVLGMEHASNKTRNALQDEGTLGATLSHMLDHGSTILRGKAILCILQMSKLQTKWFVKLCNGKFLSALERMQKHGGDEYITSCIAIFQASMPVISDALTAQITEGVDKLTARRASAHGARSTPSQSALGQSVAASCIALLGLATSTSFRVHCVGGATISRLAHWLSRMEACGMPQSLADARSAAFSTLEAVAQRADVLLLCASEAVGELFPVLAKMMTQCASGDTRFLSAKVLCDLVLFYIGEVGSNRGDLGIGGAGLAGKLEEHVVQNAPALLGDEDPIPLYALKMLVATVDFSPPLSQELRGLGLLPQLFSFLSLDHPNNNVHNLRLCRACVEGEGCLTTQEVYELGVAEKAAEVLCYTCENAVETFLEPALELCVALVGRAVRARDGRCLDVVAERCFDKLQALSGHPDASVSSLAQGCVAKFEDQWQAV